MSGRGHRISNLGLNPGEIAVALGGPVELFGERALEGFLADEVQRYATENRDMFPAVAEPGAHLILVQTDVAASVEAVLDAVRTLSIGEAMELWRPSTDGSARPRQTAVESLRCSGVIVGLCRRLADGRRHPDHRADRGEAWPAVVFFKLGKAEPDRTQVNSKCDSRARGKVPEMRT